MKKKLIDFLVMAFGLLTIIVAVCWAVPIKSNEEQEVLESELYNEYLEDDIIVDFLRGGEISPMKRWPNGEVYYKISTDFEPAQVANITSAMAAIEAVTCIRFLKAKPNPRFTPAFIDIQSDGVGCNSALGYLGRPQPFNLQKNVAKCFKVPVIIHELLHSLGFYHEHMSPDRDDYITIMWENIQPGKEKWFRKLDADTFSNFGIGYDYDSIMHYGRKTFSLDGSFTMLPLDSKAEIGQRRGLSIKDIAKINAMYKCPMHKDSDADADTYLETVANADSEIVEEDGTDDE